MDSGLLAEEKKHFDDYGFVRPFKVYEPEEAQEILKVIRHKNQDRSRAIYNNDVNYDRHFDISEMSRHIAAPPMELTVWTTLTESNKVNGCLKVMPGSHKVWYFDESKTPKTGRDQENFDPMASDTGFFGYNYAEFKVDPNWEPDEAKALALEMNPGEAVIFTARCMHGSFPNTSKNAIRFALATRYVPTDVKVYPGMTSFHEHGGAFDLSGYGCVLVSGKDDYRLNRVCTENNLGESFPAPLQPLEEEVF